MMRNFIFTLCLLYSNISIAQTECKYGDYKSLLRTWNLYQKVALTDAPDELEKFFKFPIKLYSPTDSNGVDEKPIVISRKIFLKNYSEIFQEDIAGNEIHLYKYLKQHKTEDISYVDRRIFDANECAKNTRISVAEYYFAWSKDNGWQIIAINYEGYGELIYNKKYFKK